jgi:hypothetical protein
MSDVTRILSAIEQGDPHAARQLLPLVYDELRKLAAAKLAQEKPGQTLDATALVHEAYLRLVDAEKVERWDSRGLGELRQLVALQKREVKRAEQLDEPMTVPIADVTGKEIGRLEARIRLTEAERKPTEVVSLLRELVQKREEEREAAKQPHGGAE